jgi:hypothetical protein
MSRLAVTGSREFHNVNLLTGILDLYLYDDPDLEIATYNHQSWGVESMAVCWAIENGVEFKFHLAPFQLKNHSDPLIVATTDLLCDSDEMLICWDGDDELEETFSIAPGQAKSQFIVISNNETECEVYDNYS